MNTVEINQNTIRVLVVDDQKSVRLTLKIYLESNSNIKVVDMVDNGISALEKIAAIQPDIAIIDLEMPGINGITTIEIINDRYPQTKTLVLSSHDEREYINQAILAGAKGYLLKGTCAKELHKAVLNIYQGYFQLDSSLSEKFALDINNDINIEEEYMFREVEAIPLLETEVQNEDYFQDSLQQELTEMRRELVDILEFKIHLLETKKHHMNLKFQKLQRNFSCLLAFQAILFLMFIGFSSSWFRLQQQASVNNQNQSVNVVDVSQSIK